MHDSEKQILENLFDALDRLFDHKCQVVDVHDLLFASELALKEFNPSIDLSGYRTALSLILKKNSSYEEQRKSALNSTETLRSELNELLPFE